MTNNHPQNIVPNKLSNTSYRLNFMNQALDNAKDHHKNNTNLWKQVVFSNAIQSNAEFSEKDVKKLTIPGTDSRNVLNMN